MYFKKNWDYKHGRKKQQRNDMGQSSKFRADTIPGILHSPYKLQTEYTARIMNTRNIMQLQIKLISKHLFNLLNYVTSANGCFSACLQHSPFYFEVIFKEWQWQCTFKYGDFIYLEVGSICLFFKMLLKKKIQLCLMCFNLRLVHSSVITWCHRSLERLVYTLMDTRKQLPLGLWSMSHYLRQR